jgi:hypothetical protein
VATSSPTRRLGGAAAWPIVVGAQQGDRVRDLQLQILRLQAESAAEKIGLFIKEIESQMAGRRN